MSKILGDEYLRIFLVISELLGELLNGCGVFKHADPALNLHDKLIRDWGRMG